MIEKCTAIFDLNYTSRTPGLYRLCRIRAVVRLVIRQKFHRNGGPRRYGSKAPVDEKIEKILRRELQEQYFRRFIDACPRQGGWS